MKRNIDQFSGNEYDLVIVGGGVSGAAVAWDAATRGLKVALVDKGDFGAGTSTATSKLIHGGLRYLKNLELGLVRESLRERRRLEELAPHLVYPLPFVIPVYGWMMFMLMFVGMVLYELLSFDKKRLKDPSKRLPSFSIKTRKRLLASDSHLAPRKLVGGFQYYDCQSLNPDRLTLAFVQSAVEAGAHVANYVRAEGLVTEGKRVTGVTAVDLETGKPVTLKCKQALVAAGPWADLVLAKVLGHPPQTRIRRSKGIHVLVNEKRPDFALTLAGPTGGHFFIIPWRDQTLIGTTDTEFIGKPDDCDVTAEDISKFLAAVNVAYGNLGKYKPEDVVFAYSGLRPLVDKQTDNVYNTSRKHEIVDHTVDGIEGLFSVLGGKYTTSRELAEEVVNRIAAKLGNTAPCKTRDDGIRLAGGGIADMQSFMTRATADLAFLGARAADSVARLYGTAYPAVAAIAKENPALAKPVGPGDVVLAEAVYALREEMAVTLEDLVFRRTGLGTLGNPGDDVIKHAAELAQRELGWSDERKRDEIARVMRRLDYPRVVAPAAA